MRDLHLRHTLTSLSRDAAEVFTDLVESGQEIPYEIGEPGGGFAFCQYQPLTARFVRDNATELRDLPSFREAAETLRRSELAGTYLEEAGITPPADPAERSNMAVTYFLARLWDGCSEFELDDDRFAAVVAEIEECAEPEEGEVEAIVPLLGFQMEGTRVELNGASIVRADAVDIPAEASRGERPSGAAWEPTFVISARVALDADGGLGGAGERVAKTFERIVSTLRLLKPGGVGLAPHGWVRVAGDRWRRISTGCGRPRPGGYRLLEGDLESLTDLARTVAVHPRRVARLRRSLLRFETGLDRRGAIDALNDHLLALRFMLEGEGPAGVGLPMRVAALAEDGADRDAARATIEHAVALERELWSGEPLRAEDGRGPSEVAADVEELLRTILCRGISGELGSDLRAAADETLLADGLAFGEGDAAERGGTTEWDLDVAETDAEEIAEIAEMDSEPAAYDLENLEEEDFEVADAERIVVSRGPGAPGPLRAAPEPAVDYPDKPEVASEAASEADASPEEQEQRVLIFAEAETGVEETTAGGAGTPEADDPGPSDWLDEVEGEATMDFPARSSHLHDLAKSPMDREEVRERVNYLFPRTETNWTVGQRASRRAS